MTTTTDLIITNGDVAGELLRWTLPGAEVLPWRDVLDKGPVPLTATLALTAIRAAYLAGRSWGDAVELRENLEARNRGLAQADTFDRVVLWFEHDLYDQLQLLQVLDWFNENRREDGLLLLVQASEFLGQQTPEQILALKDLERPVTENQLALASEAWSAFRAATPEPWYTCFSAISLPCPFCNLPCCACSKSFPARIAYSAPSGRPLQR